MDDVTPWTDPELVAAGRLLQSRGLIAPDRTVAPLAEVRAAQDRIGAFLGEGSVPLRKERDLSLPGPHGQVPCRLYLPDDVEHPGLIVYAHGGAFVQGSLPSWDHFLRDLVRLERCRSAVRRLSPGAGASLPGGLRRHGGDNQAGGSRRRRVRDRPDAARGRRRFRPGPVWRSARRWRCAMPAKQRCGLSY